MVTCFRQHGSPFQNGSGTLARPTRRSAAPTSCFRGRRDPDNGCPGGGARRAEPPLRAHARRWAHASMDEDVSRRRDFPARGRRRRLSHRHRPPALAVPPPLGRGAGGGRRRDARAPCHDGGPTAGGRLCPSPPRSTARPPDARSLPPAHPCEPGTPSPVIRAIRRCAPGRARGPEDRPRRRRRSPLRDPVRAGTPELHRGSVLERAELVPDAGRPDSAGSALRGQQADDDRGRFAAAVGRSRQRTHARFTQLSGTRPSAFLRRERVRRAAGLLAAGETDRDRIAKASGYATRQGLCRAFLREFGVTPAAHWRAIHRRPFPKPTGVPAAEQPRGPARTGPGA